MGRAPVRVGLLYPPAFHADPAGQARAAATIAAVDPGVRVLVEPYAEDPALRTRRSVAGHRPGPADQTPVTAAQRRALGQLDVAVALDLPYAVAELAPSLRWVQAVGTGVGQLRSAGLGAADVTLTNAAGTSSAEIAEFVLARILEHRKRLPDIAAAQRRGDWQPRYGRSMATATVGLVGYGAINAAVARLARAFGMRVLATRRDPTRAAPEEVDQVYGPAQLHAMLAASDVVVAALPETAATTGLLDGAAFAAMAPGTFFCNVGRGSSVDEAALLDALDSGRLTGAALDVFAEEPLPASSPLWAHPGVQASAHCSSVPDATIERVVALFVDNLGRWLDGEPLRNVVDLDRGY